MKDSYYGKARAKIIAEELREYKPILGFTLGSGWGGTVKLLENIVTVPYAELGMPPCGVEGHTGQFVFGTLSGIPIMIQQGRYHLYEGRKKEDTIFPLAIMKEMGIESVILTNAAGAVNETYNVGDLMFLSDHVNLTGRNPLVGIRPTNEYPVFVDMTSVYDVELTDQLEKAANKAGMTNHRGIYFQLLGPSFETPAEIRMFRMMGADAVGMSSVTEAIYAKYLHLRVATVSCMSNMAAGMTENGLSHTEVLNQSLLLEDKLTEFLSDFIINYK